MKITSKVVLLSLYGVFLFGQTGYEIAKAVDERKAPLDMTADLKMILTNKRGKTRTNEIRSVSKDNSAKQIIWFFAPPDDKGVAFLKIEHDDKDDEMRLWLPAFKKIRRISASKKGDAFMGSDLSFEDLTSRELDDFTYDLTGDTLLDGKACYVLTITPKPETDTEYTRHTEWVTKKNYLVIRAESYDKSGELLKIRRIDYKEQEGYDVPTRIYVENVKKKHNTLLTFEHIKLDTGVKDALFQEKNLKRLPPR
ncbi:MAG: outer membrane lipoprotein-sorting protein [FCB group bacterium]|nr:outer membrane lipoprotein-sorting protein [FCB group bacterium]